MPLQMVFHSTGLLLSAAAASASEAQPAAGSGFGPLLVGLAVLVVGAKLGGSLVARWGQPSVLGELLFGIVLANLAPVFFGEVGIEFVRANETLRFLAQIGVLLLLFDVGLETDLSAFTKVGASAALVAVVGVIAPLGLGWAAARWLLPESPTLVHVFIGATLSATSVGITVRVLKDLGVTGRPEGQTIIGAAILDDILGLIVLAVVAGSVSGADSGTTPVAAVSIAAIVLKAVGFLGITIVLGHYLSRKIVRLATLTGEHGTLLIIGVALCFTFAYIAERVGLADIIGAFAAGVFLDPYGKGVYTKAEETTLRELLAPLSDVLVPLFFRVDGVTGESDGIYGAFRTGFGPCLDRQRRPRQIGLCRRCHSTRYSSLACRYRHDSPRRGRINLCRHWSVSQTRRSTDFIRNCLIGDRRNGCRYDISHADRPSLGVPKIMLASNAPQSGSEDKNDYATAQRGARAHAARLAGQLSHVFIRRLS